MGFDEFDEERYQRANPDVAVMVARGLFRSALDHWQRSGSLEHAAGRRRTGFYEHDLIYDEETYLRQNADVLALLQKRVIGTGYEHWIRHGRVEFSRGRRHAPFVAETHAFRPFRLTLGDAGALFVCASEADPCAARALTLRHGDDPAVSVPPSAVAWTSPLRIVDGRNGGRTLRFALLRSAPLGAEGRRPRPLWLSDMGAALSCARDAGMQAFFFAEASGANEFLARARALDWAEARKDFVDQALTAFAVGRLQGTPDPREPFSGFFLERLARRGATGFDAAGWFAPADGGVARVSVWCPETSECAEVESITRIERPDVRLMLGDGKGIAADAILGFEGFLPLPLATALTPRRLVFGVTPRTSVTRFFESSHPPFSG